MAILKNTIIDDSGAVTIPVGTSSNRPSPTNGMVRFNTDLQTPEVYVGIWQAFISSGTVEFFAGSTAPAGWLKANGATVSRTTYAALFSAIGTTYGAGDGSTTFTLPDLRGCFLRMLDDSRGIDAGRVVGSFQEQDWKGFFETNTVQNGTNYVHNDVYMGKSTVAYVGNLFAGWWANASTAIGTQWDTSEIRPKNNALLACIKY